MPGYGKVALAAMLPILSHMGHNIYNLPTALLTVRRAAAADLPTLLRIFDNARAFMRTHGNPHQWPDSYPGAARLTAEIERGVCYVVMGDVYKRQVQAVPEGQNMYGMVAAEQLLRPPKAHQGVGAGGVLHPVQYK